MLIRLTQFARSGYASPAIPLEPQGLETANSSDQSSANDYHLDLTFKQVIRGNPSAQTPLEALELTWIGRWLPTLQESAPEGWLLLYRRLSDIHSE